MRSTPLAIVMTTVASRADARRLADGLLDTRLAACVQVLPIRSTYRWQGRIEHGDEYLLLIKTRAALTRRVRVFLRGQHPYDVPEILAVRVADALPAYRRWVAAETAAPRAP